MKKAKKEKVKLPMSLTKKLVLTILGLAAAALIIYLAYYFLYFVNYDRYEDFLSGYSYETGTTYQALNDTDKKVEGFDLVAENDFLKLYTDTATGYVAVYNKKDGSITYSNPLNADEDEKANKSNKNYLKAQMMVYYYGGAIKSAPASYDTYTQCVQKNQLAVESIANGVRYIYTVGEMKTKDGAEGIYFEVPLEYRLENDSLVVSVPTGKIVEHNGKVCRIQMLRYMGAAHKSETGYLVVPNGSGSIINFNNGKVAQNPYYASVYGWDMCLDRDALVHETRTSFNVFGEAKGDASYICILEQGAPYAAIQADISGRTNSYNYVNARYTVTKREQYDVSDKYNGDMFVYEEKLPEESYVQRYRFVNSVNYSDMAKAYQDYLFETYEGAFTKQTTAESPVLVEFVGAVDKVKQILGVPVSRPLALTTFAEAETMVEELKNSGMQELSVKFTGWANGGMQQSMLSKVKVVKDLGGEKALKAFMSKAGELGVPVYLDGITNYAIDSDLTDGFFVFADAARFVSKEKAELYEYSTTSYEKREDLDEYYLLKEPLIQEMVDNLVAEVNSYNAGVSFADIGRDLSSDFTKKAPVSRQQVMENQQTKLAEISKNTNVMVNDGNDYVIAYTDMVSNMDLRGATYTIIDQTVPFYQMALHGYVEYVGESLNLTKDPVDELLKSAEYGAGLSFTLMEETSFTLQNTLYTEYFGAEYAACKDSMYEIYNRYNKELGHVFNQEMTNHEYVAANVTCTTYEDGTKVYVNYTYNDYTAADGTVVPAKDYTVTR